jgi:hypothetical protein
MFELVKFAQGTTELGIFELGKSGLGISGLGLFGDLCVVVHGVAVLFQFPKA